MALNIFADDLKSAAFPPAFRAARSDAACAAPTVRLSERRPLLPAPSSGPSDDRPVCAVAVITKPFSHHNERLC